MPLGVDETSKWCNSFVLIPKANDKVSLFLHLDRHIAVLIRPIHKDPPTLNGILPGVAGVKYLKSIYASSEYHNLKLDRGLLYLSFSCPFDRYRYI